MAVLRTVSTSFGARPDSKINSDKIFARSNIFLLRRIRAPQKWFRIPTYTERAVALIKPFIENNTIGVATVATVPDGNYEVWFKGPYDAEKIKRVEMADQPE